MDAYWLHPKQRAYIQVKKMSSSSYTTNRAIGEEVLPGKGDAATEDKATDLVRDLTSYLSNLGLGEAHLAKVISLLQSLGREELPFKTVQPAEPLGPSAKQTIKLYLVEEQQILREAYLSFFGGQRTIEVVGSSGDTSSEAMVSGAKTLKPKVILLGVKAVQAATVEKLALLREACPQAGLVLLFAFYDLQGIKALREFSSDASAGCAYLLKHTIDTVEQLVQVVYSVAEGRIIIDPMVMEELIRTGDARNSFLKELSPKELEVLGWMAKGYRNETIAEVLSRDVKTIERHINNIYGKFQDTDDSSNPRVRAALLYLRATGLLSTEQPGEE
jgi:DNA-binding NarL/FixJ family response regulator